MSFRVVPTAVSCCALLALVVAGGCEKPHSVPPEDQQFRVGQEAASYCPSIISIPGNANAYVSRSKVTATVFAKDGEVAPNQPVRFEDVTGAPGVSLVNENNLPIPDNTVTTDSTGRAFAWVLAEEASRPGRLVVESKKAYYQAKVQGTLLSNNTVAAPVVLVTPPMPTVFWGYSATSLVVGSATNSETTVSIGMTGVCNLAKLAATVNWERDYLELTSVKEAPTSPLGSDSPGDGTVYTEISPVPAGNPGVLDLYYNRAASAPAFEVGTYKSWGRTGSGVFVNLVFKAIGVPPNGGTTTVTLSNPHVFAAGASSPVGSLEYALQPFNLVAPTATVTIQPAPAPSRSRSSSSGYPPIQPRTR